MLDTDSHDKCDKHSTDQPDHQPAHIADDGAYHVAYHDSSNDLEQRHALRHRPTTSQTTSQTTTDTSTHPDLRAPPKHSVIPGSLAQDGTLSDSDTSCELQSAVEI